MKSKVFRFLFKLTSLWLIMLFVFWECDHILSYPNIRDGLSNPHAIDFVGVVRTYHWPTFVTFSLYLNIFYSTTFLKFYKWVESGKIRIGGKSGNG